jgi:hypothetical protein
MSWWALPSAADAALFTPTIERLARVTATSPFPPHITIPDTPRPTTPYAVTLTHVDDEDYRFRCITLRAGDNGEHLSLLYADLSAEERAALRDTVDVPLPLTITIDAIARVDTSGDVSAWRTVEHYSLVAG